MSDEGTPTVESLSEQLKDLVDWESFALDLPGINYTDIQIIRRDYSETQVQKMELFSCWIKAYPQATWEDVSKALKENHEFSLVQNINLYQQEKRVEMACDYNIKLTVDALCSSLRGLSHWEELAIHLPGITTEVIDVVKCGHPPEDHMTCLFSKWLEVCSTPSWDSILKAINETKAQVREKILAEHLLKDVCSKVFLPYMMYKPTVHALTEKLKGLKNWTQFGSYLPRIQLNHLDTIMIYNHDNLEKELFRVWLDIHPTARWIDVLLALDKSDNTSLAHALRANLPSKALDSPENQFEKEIREETVKTLRSLYEAYQSLYFDFEKEMSQKDISLLSMIQWVKQKPLCNSEKMLLSAAKSFQVFFNCIAIHHDFLNCYLPLSLARQFLKSDSPITMQLESHSENVQEFMKSTEIQSLRTSLEPFVHKYPVQVPITIKLHHCYEKEDICFFQTLLKKLFGIDQSKLLQIFRVTPGSVLVTLLAPRYAVNELKNIASTKDLFMRLVGILSLQIEKNYVIIRVTNDYSYEIGLITALENREYEAIKFLLIETKVDVNARAKPDYLYECVKRHSTIRPSLQLDDADEQKEGDKGSEDAQDDNVQSLPFYDLGGGDDNSNLIFPRELDATPLMIACYNSDTDLVQLLLEKGADPNLQTETGQTALMYAASVGSGRAIKLLLKFKAEINKKKQSNGTTALHHGCRTGNGRAVDVLLEHLADPNMKMKDGGTPLHIASENGRLEIVKKLLRAKVNPDIPTTDGLTPLHRASEKGHYKVVDELLKAKVRPNHPAFDGITPLYIASYYGHLKVVHRLLKEKVDPNVHVKSNGVTSMMAASWSGHLEIVEALLQANADPNAVSSTGNTSLMFASESGYSNIVEALLKERKTLIDARSEDGKTALFLASECGWLEVVQKLLEANANPNAKNDSRITPLMVAQTNRYHSIVEKLCQYGAVGAI